MKGSTYRRHHCSELGLNQRQERVRIFAPQIVNRICDAPVALFNDRFEKQRILAGTEVDAHQKDVV